MMLQWFYFRNATDYLQFQHLFYFICTKISDSPAALPLPYDRLPSNAAPIPPFLYKDR